jgi:hypothetical protein
MALWDPNYVKLTHACHRSRKVSGEQYIVARPPPFKSLCLSQPFMPTSSFTSSPYRVTQPPQVSEDDAYAVILPCQTTPVCSRSRGIKTHKFSHVRALCAFCARDHCVFNVCVASSSALRVGTAQTSWNDSGLYTSHRYPKRQRCPLCEATRTKLQVLFPLGNHSCCHPGYLRLSDNQQRLGHRQTTPSTAPDRALKI